MRATLLLTSLLVLGIMAGTSAAQQFNATIDGSQEVPPVATPATGLGCFTLNQTTGMLNFSIAFGALLFPETAAHIHGPALVGQNAGVIFPLPLGSPKVGAVGPLTAVQLADLSNGLWYVNIHSQGFPGGEIRGQILTGPGNCPPVSVEENTWGRIKAQYR